MILDITKYMSYLDGIDLSVAQKEEMIRTVWGIMESSVDQAFGQHPVQQVRAVWTKENLHSAGSALDSKEPSMAQAFKRAAQDAANEAQYKQERKA